MLVLGLVEVPWWCFPIIAVIGYIMYSCRDFNYFRKQGIPGDTPYPIFGTSLAMMKESLAYKDVENLKRYGDLGYWGEFYGSRPSLLVADADMISKIMVKEFPSFTNKLWFKANDDVWDVMLGNAEMAHWKHLRKEMTPVFSTGKLKKMNSGINECAKSLADNLYERAKQHEDVKIKEYAGGYTTEVIAITGFGIRANSQKDRHNAFVRNAKKVLQFNPTSPEIFIPVFLPELSTLLSKLRIPLPIYSKEVTDFFFAITKETMDLRKANVEQTRTDFIQLMVDAQERENTVDDKHLEKNTAYSGMSTKEIMANSMLFFAAGYETTLTTLSFLFYNLALNQDCQEKLVEEVNRVVGEEEDVELTMLQEMPYIDQCINESMRLFPVTMRINRWANKDIEINGIFIRKGALVEFPVYAIHHDPKRWPNPEKFDPERFSAKNKQSQNPGDFLPFGNGPRNCIGMRLALQELKVAIIHVLRKVKVTNCDKTPVPLLFDASAINILNLRGDLWITVTPREKE